jgi:hypothetical protein
MLAETGDVKNPVVTGIVGKQEVDRDAHGSFREIPIPPTIAKPRPWRWDRQPESGTICGIIGSDSAF